MTDLKRVDELDERAIDDAAQNDPDGLILEDCDLSSLEVVMPSRKQSVSMRVDRDLVLFQIVWQRAIRLE